MKTPIKTLFGMGNGHVPARHAVKQVTTTERNACGDWSTYRQIRGDLVP